MDETTEAEQKVGAAIALLDEHGPEGWRERVNLDRLSMMSWRWCILGQVYEDDDEFATQRAGVDLSGAYLFGLNKLGEAIGRDTVAEVEAAFANWASEWRRQLSGAS